MSSSIRPTSPAPPEPPPRVPPRPASGGANPEQGAQRFNVPNQNGDVLFAYNGSARAGQNVAQAEDIGLSIALTTGALHEGQGAHPAPPAAGPQQVDPGALFAAADINQRPRFEGGKRVVAGSFLANGQRIEVRGDDNITSVLQRLAENLPEVAPSFADDKVRLSMRTRVRRPLVIEGDTSGFVAATGLDEAARELTSAGATAHRAERAYAGRKRG